MAIPLRGKLLIVDDSPSNIMILNGLLRKEHDTLFATSGVDALALAEREMPDLILLDVVMPGLDGYEVLTRLKANPETRDIPVIFVTSLEDAAEEERGLTLGAVDFITKPIRAPIVAIRVKNHLELKHHRDRLKALSTTDMLTGVANRRRFEETFEREWRRAVRDQAPISLAMIDIDSFKQYNDHYGHLAGDECLVQVATLLAATLLRPADLLARFGGEEFVAVLPNTDHNGAAEIGQRLCAAVRNAQLEHTAAPTGPYVTASVGIATVTPTQDMSNSDLLAAADRALYRAKQSGRNRVVAWVQREA